MDKAPLSPNKRKKPGKFIHNLSLVCCFVSDSFQAHHKLPSKPRDAEKVSHDLEKLGPIAAEVLAEDVNEMDVGAGLQNEVGEYNCFLNVIIQVCRLFQLFIIISISPCI